VLHIDLRCNEVQGFLFSAPKSAAEVETLLREQAAKQASVA
jgi:EAL domain-containing protein (putative c-di-GMP-specific phosphodiesterase class I)